MSDGYIQVSVQTTPESLAHDIVHSLDYDEVLLLMFQIDSAMHDWGFTTELINGLKEALP